MRTIGNIKKHEPLPFSVGSNLTRRKLPLQYLDEDPSEFVRQLARLAILGAKGERPVLPGLLAERVVEFCATHPLDEMRQLEQLYFLRH